MSDRSGRSASRPFVRDALLPFLVTRVLLVAAGWSSLAWIAPDAHGLSIAWQFPLPVTTHPLVEMWMRWDAEWYATIAAIGYRAPVDTPDIRPGFFPLYPLLLAGLARTVGDYAIAGLLLANAAALGFLALLRKVVAETWNDSIAARVVWLYLAYPSSFYLSSAYAEPLLLLFYGLTWWAVQRQRTSVAAAALALATLTRPTGVLAVPGFAWMWWNAGRTPRARWRGVLAIGVAVLAALTVYFAFSVWTFGDAFATFKLQAAARAPFSWPWRSFAPVFETPYWLGWGNSIFDAGLATLAIALLPFVGWRLGGPLALIAALLVIVPLGSGLMTFSRSLLVAFPVFVVLGHSIRRRAAVVAAVAAGLALQAWHFALFVAWVWVA